MSDASPTTACPDAATLRALLDGTLPEDQQTTTQAHVDRCRTCEAALRQMTAGGESWVGMAEKLKGDSSDDPKLAAAMERLKTDDGSASEIGESADPQRTLDFLSPSDDPKSLGRLGQHEVLEVIGWGGMGVVLKAYDPGLHRVVAVKVLASHLAHHAVARKRFIREAQAAAAVCHDNVVTIHAIDEAKFVVPPLGGQAGKENIPPEGGTTNALPKIVMQFVAGGSLQERIDQDGPLELKEILRIAMQTAAGLAAAHAQGVVHRDVKPANILLENGVQRVKLTDFGLARVMDDASLTLSGVIAGTPQYMAPEQAWGRDVDARADLFSLGAVMYAMCTGHSPFRARTTMAVLKRVCEDAPRPLRAINPDIPDWLVAIIEKLLAKKPEDRFQSATEVSELLGRWLAHVQQPTVVPAPPRIIAAAWRAGRVRAAESLAEKATTAAASLWAMRQLQSRPEELRHRLRWFGVVILIGLLFGIPTSLFVMSSFPAPSTWTPTEAFRYTVAAAVVIIGVFLLLAKLNHWLFVGDGQSIPLRRETSTTEPAPEVNGSEPPHGRWQLSRGIVWLPLVATGTVLGIMAALIVAENRTRDLSSFFGFSTFHLLVTFALSSAFRTAWNSSSWLPWIASILLLPAAAGVFALMAANEGAPLAVDLLCTLQALLALAMWLGLLFVRPLLVQGSDRWMRERLTGWQRLFAIAGVTIVGTPLALTLLYLMARIPLEQASNIRIPDPSNVFVVPADKRRTPEQKPNGFPKPQLLSSEETPGTSSGMTVEVHPLAALPEALKPLQGRWVVVSSEGATLNPAPSGPSGLDEAPQGGAPAAAPGTFGFYGGGAGSMAPGGGMPGGSMPGGVTPAATLQWIEFAADHVTVFDGREAKLFAHFNVTQEPKRLTLKIQPLDGSSLWSIWRSGIFRLERDRLILCWTTGDRLPPTEFVTEDHYAAQLLVLRREWNPPPDFDPFEALPPRAVIPFTADEGRRFQAAWAKASNVPVETTNSLGMKLRLLPAGAFDPAGADALSKFAMRPVSANVAQPIYLGVHEVTVAQFRQFVAATGYETTAERLPPQPGIERRTWRHPGIVQDSDQHPVVQVSWQDAQAFCRWLSDTEQQSYRLPTITEWAFAARAGLASRTPLRLPHNVRLRFFDTTAPVGSDTANLFGLHDLFGNVSEWANDNLAAPETGGGFGGDGGGGLEQPYKIVHRGFVATSLGGGYQSSRKRDDGSEWMLPQVTQPQLNGDTGDQNDVGFRVARLVNRNDTVPAELWPPVEGVMATATRLALKAKKPANDGAQPKATDQARVFDGPLVVVRGVVPVGSLPQPAECVDFEIERAHLNSKDLNFDEQPSLKPVWQKLDVAKTLQILEASELAADPVPVLRTNSVFTMPLLVRADDSPWPPELVTHPQVPLQPPKSKYDVQQQLFRFIDFDVAPGQSYDYRIRLKFSPIGSSEKSPVIVTPWSQDTVWVTVK